MGADCEILQVPESHWPHVGKCRTLWRAAGVRRAQVRGTAMQQEHSQ
jgi:hypothetical protein